MSEINLSRGLTSKVDEGDVEFLSRWRWHAKDRGDGKFYAVRKVTVGGRRVTVPMARMVAGVAEGEIDHINGDTLDNRRENLRACSHKQNMLNRRARHGGGSQFRGVSWYRPSGMWVAHFRREYVGYYLDEFDAAQAYNARVAERLSPENMKFVVLNDIPGRGKLAVYPASYWQRKAKSRFRGVGWNEQKQKWTASITVRGKRKFLGLFPDEEGAATVFDRACDRMGVPERKNDAGG